jgi:hypothetical protein
VGIWTGLGLPRIDRWRTLVSAVMNLGVPWNAGNFLTICKPVSCSRTLHYEVSIVHIPKGQFYTSWQVTTDDCSGTHQHQSSPNYEFLKNILLHKNILTKITKIQKIVSRSVDLLCN